MIPNQWYAVLDSKEVPHNQPIGVTRLGEKLVFWRTKVVITEQPIKSELRMHEILVRADRPITEYSRRREELIQDAATVSKSG